MHIVASTSPLRPMTLPILLAAATAAAAPSSAPGLRRRGVAALAPFAVPILASLYACGPGGGSGQQREDAAEWQPVSTWQVSDSTLLSIGGAEAAGEAVLHGARHATRLGDGSVVIADGTSREVRFFGADGGHLRTVGGQGSGPGEFNFLTWLGRMRGDTVLAYDEATRRLALFTPDGEHVRTVLLHLPATPSFPSVVGAFDDGRLLARPSFDRRFGRGERRDTVPFFIYERDGQRADTIGHFASEEMYFIATPEMSTRQNVGFGRDVFAAVAGDHAVIGTSDDYALSIFRSTGALERRLQGSRGSVPVSPSEEREWRATLTTGLPLQFRARLEPLLDQVPARTTHPAFGGVRMDRAGHYWVMDHPRTRDGPRRWWIYRLDGAAVATVVTPPRFEILEVGADWLLGRSLDDDGVETVEVRALFRQ